MCELRARERRVNSDFLTHLTNTPLPPQAPQEFLEVDGLWESQSEIPCFSPADIGCLMISLQPY